MRLAQPPGVRSCRDGGVWEYCHHSKGGNFWMQELDLLMDGLASSDRALTKSELMNKMRRAMDGKLDFGSGAACDVDFMVCTHCVLEVRLAARRGADNDVRHIRLYFTEPEDHDCVLLALKLTWKSPGEPGLEEQTAHAMEAQVRADAHHDWIKSSSNG